MEDDFESPLQYLENNRYYIENMQSAEIYDTTGVLVRRFEANQIIDLGYLPTGTYFIKYFVNNKSNTEKVVRF